MSGEAVVMAELERRFLVAADQAIHLMGEVALDAVVKTGTLAISGAWLGTKWMALVCGRVAAEISGNAEQERRQARKRAESALFAQRQVVMDRMDAESEKAGQAIRRAQEAAKSSDSSTTLKPAPNHRGPNIQARLEALTLELEHLSTAQKQTIGRGLPALEKKLNELQRRLKQGRTLSGREVDGLASSLHLLIARSAEAETRNERLLSQLHERMLEVFAEMAEFRELPPPAEAMGELEAIAQALELLMIDSRPDPARVVTLAETWNRLKQRLVSFVQIKNYRQQLAKSSIAHLTGAGYELMTGFPDDIGQQAGDAFLAIPGGEILRVHLDEACRLRFLVLHATTGNELEFPREHFTAFQAQEEKFCRDLPNIIQALQNEGFVLKIASEEKLSVDGVETAQVETVQVETAEDIRRRGRERRPARIKYSPKKKEKRHLPC